MGSCKYDGFKEDTSNSADENVTPRVPRTKAHRINIKKDVGVAVEIAGDDDGVHSTTRGVQQAMRFPS